MEEIVGTIEASALNCPRPSTGRILSASELEEMKKNLNLLSDSVDNYIRKTQQVISTFNDQNIVQSFYSSGKFGTEQRQKLEKIGTALQKYWNVINGGEDSMIGQTNKYIEMSLENVSGGTSSGSASSTGGTSSKGGNFKSEIIPLYADDTNVYTTNNYQSLSEYLENYNQMDGIVTINGGVK